MRAGLTRKAALQLLTLAAVLGAIWIPAYSKNAQTDQNQLKQLSLEQLGSVEVTTRSKTPEQVWKTPAAIFVITQEDIRRSGATSIPEALRLAPGVEVAKITEDKWSIGIRGFGSRLNRSVLVLIDGRSVYTTLIAGTYWEVQDYVLEDIDRIEVIRGPGGTVWGPNAVNGVINIITKNSKDTQGTLVTAGGGNVEQGSGSVRYGGGNSKGLSYRVYGKGFLYGPERHFDGNNYDRWKSAQAGFRTDWVKNERDSFTFQGDLYAQRAGDTEAVTNYVPPSSATVTGTEFLSGGNFLGRWTRKFNEGNDIQLQAYYDSANRHEVNFGDLRDTFDVDFLQRFRIGSRNEVSWGAGARASHGHELEVSPGLVFSPAMRTDQLYTGFLQDDISLLPNRLMLEVGTKLLGTNYSGLEPEPSARLLWTPTSTQTVWLAATRAVRTPSDGEEDFFLSHFIGPGNDGPLFARINANPNFQSEKLDGYELGYRGLAGHTVYVDVAGFFNNYHDLFSEDLTVPLAQLPIVQTSLPFPGAGPATYDLIPAAFGNGLKGSTLGGEVAPEWRVTGFWRLRGSYSFLHMVLKPGPNSRDVGTAPIVAGSSPQHQVQVQSSFDLPKRFSLDLDYRYVSALPGISIGAYSTGDVRLGWLVGNHWEISVVGNNLLQPYHIESADDPGPNVGIRRSAFAKLVWRSQKN